MDHTRSRGDRGEAIAADYLRSLGWRVVDSNVYFRVGELDLIAEYGDTLVFVEVRSRAGRFARDAAHTVTLPKQRRLTRAARLYLARYQGPCPNARFDVVAVDRSAARVTDHFEGAFDAVDY